MVLAPAAGGARVGAIREASPATGGDGLQAEATSRAASGLAWPRTSAALTRGRRVDTAQEH
jgi:hypothetical protein